MDKIIILVPAIIFFFLVILVVNLCIRKNVKKSWFIVFMCVSIALVLLGVFTPLNTYYFLLMALLVQVVLLFVSASKKFGRN